MIDIYSIALNEVAKGKWLEHTQTYETIVWKNENDIVQKEIIDAKITELQTDYDSKQYQRDRAVAYPSIPDQLDTIYHQGLDAWKAEIKAVKDAHPKPEST